MYDTVGLNLFVEDGRGISPLDDVPPRLDRLAGVNHLPGHEYVSGYLGDLKITARPHSVRVSRGSICKWHFGDNYQTLDRRDMHEAVEHLSDTLHLPMSEAEVTRLDFGTNLIMKHPIPAYLGHLGTLRYYRRNEASDGLYYCSNGKELNFYDKNRERQRTGAPIPELYTGRDVLRYEIRYTSRLPRHFNRLSVTAADLYDRAFFDEMLHRWRDTYRAIQKINDITPDFSMITKKSELNRLGVLALVEKYGGQQKFLKLIDERRITGTLTKKQASDLRAAVNDACTIREGTASASEFVAELDKKIRDTVKMY